MSEKVVIGAGWIVENEKKKFNRLSRFAHG